MFSLQQQQQQIMAQMQLTHQALTLGQGNSTTNTPELPSGLGSLLGSKGTKLEAGTGGRERHLSEGFGGSTSTSGKVTLTVFNVNFFNQWYSQESLAHHRCLN